MNESTFEGQRIWSEEFASITEIEKFLLANIPNATDVEKALDADDRMGIDYWVNRKSLRPLGIDVKARKYDPIEIHHKDDLALEIWSVQEKEKIGWTRDPTKATDYVLWYFCGTKRCVLVPFPCLCSVFTANLAVWSSKYQHARQGSTDGSGKWHSECLFVPRAVVWDAILRTYGGASASFTP